VISRVIETRRNTRGFKTRRYERSDGERFSTIEVPLEVWNALNKTGRGNDRMAGWLRKMGLNERRHKVISLHKDKWKPVAIAVELQIPERTVHRYITEYHRFNGKETDGR